MIFIKLFGIRWKFSCLLLSELLLAQAVMVKGIHSVRIRIQNNNATKESCISLILVNSWISIIWSRFALWVKCWQKCVWGFVCFFRVFCAVVLQCKMVDLFPTCQMGLSHKREKQLLCRRSAKSNLFYEYWLVFLT